MIQREGLMKLRIRIKRRQILKHPSSAPRIAFGQLAGKLEINANNSPVIYAGFGITMHNLLNIINHESDV